MCPACPDREQLQAYAAGKISDQTANTVAGHIDECTDCQAALETIDDAEDSLVMRLRRAPVREKYQDESQYEEAMERAAAAAGRLLPSGDEQTIDGTGSAEASELQEIGEYQLLEKLGQGGMGMVYKALQTKLQREVAIKLLPKNRMDDQKAVARFEREMAAIGGLDHPNIVRATHAGEHEGASYLVMDYVDGLDLSEVARRCGPLPVADACELVRQTAVALQYVHDNGLVHRDIKPSNLMLTSDGQVKVLDLGLALLQENQPTDGEVTAAGQAMGTADYIAPEQTADSHTVDIRADVYSLGCTLFRLLAGRAPYVGKNYKNAFEKMMGHVRDPLPSIKEIRGDLPERLVAVVEQMLAKNPDDRPAKPEAVAEAMEPFARDANLPQLIRWAETHGAAPAAHAETLDGSSVPAADGDEEHASPTEKDSTPYARFRQAQPSSGRRSRRPAVLVGLALAGVLAFGAIFTVVTNRGTLEIKTYDDDVQVSILKGGKEVAILDTKTGNKVTLYAGQYSIRLSGGKGDLQLSTDTFTLRRGDKVIVEVRRRSSIAVRAPEPPNVTVQLRATLRGHTGDVRSMAVSPQGKTLATASFDGTVKLWDMASRKELATLRGHTGRVNCVVFSSDGKMLASAGVMDKLVKLWDVATGKELHTLEGNTARVFSVTFAPDGRTVASAGADGTVKVWDVAKGTELATLAGHSREVEAVAFSPDGRLLASGSWDDTVILWNVSTWKEQATLRADTDILSVAFSPDGKTLATASNRGTIKLWDVATRKARTAWQAHTKNVYGLAFAPDGKTLASSSQDGTFKIWDASTGKILASYRENQLIWSIAFSRDGLTLLTAGSDGTVKLWDVAALLSAGSAPTGKALPNGWVIHEPVNLGPTVNSSSNDCHPVLSADGLTLLLGSTRPGGQGSKDLWMCTRTSASEAFGKPVNLGPTVNSNFEDCHPELSADGLTLLLCSDRPGGQGKRDLWMCTRTSPKEAFGRPVNLGPTVNSPLRDGSPRISRDGLMLLFDSTRPGGQGSVDLWICTRTSGKEAFGEPVNLGPTVNSSASDADPALSQDGLTLVFDSGRSPNQGWRDLWMCTRTFPSGQFGEPVHLGPTVNSREWDGGPSLSADGRTLWFDSLRPGGQGNWDLWTARIEHREIPPAEQVTDTNAAAIAEVKKLGGTFLADSGGRSSWSPDSARIVYPRGKLGLWILDPSTGKQTELLAVGKDPAWSPDGRLIAYVRGHGYTDEIWLVESSGENPRKLADGGWPTWSSDGKTLFFQSRKPHKLMAARFDGSEPKISEILDVPWLYPAVSPDGTEVAYRAGKQLVVVDVKTGAKIRTWPLPSSNGLLPAWSPDGKLLGFGGYGQDGGMGLWIVNVESRQTFRLAGGEFTSPAWSPDGSKLTFALRAQKGGGLWMLDTKALKDLEPLELPGTVPPETPSQAD